MVKKTNLKRITVKKSKSLFYKEQIAPITVYLKMTFSPVALYKRGTGANRSCRSLHKEPWERFALYGFYKKSDGSEPLLLLFS